jgi:cell division protein FtsB
LHICHVKQKPIIMTLSLSQDTYSQTIVAQQAQIKALQDKVQELNARIEVLEQQAVLFI